MRQRRAFQLKWRNACFFGTGQKPYAQATKGLTTRLMLTVLALCIAVPVTTHAVLGGQPTLTQISNAITEMDVTRAAELISKVKTPSLDLALERARLAIYFGDCDGAAAILRAPDLQATKAGASLNNLATRCAMATAGSLIVEDKLKGLWFRLQDADDKVLLPYIADVVSKALTQHAKDLGTELPRPIRVDLVRDLFTLSAISGLPLQAAETTGTVAVARWGRVTLLSPRAAPEGYPWQDTVAHELSHLVVSRATRDNSPLWLQEGLAKHQETRWRPVQPFDEQYQPDKIAYVAMATGQQVGLDQLGSSIAMLPSPQAASIAFAEVTSFIQFWIGVNGATALKLLLQDLRGLGPDAVDAGLKSVSGYSLANWDRRWRHSLREKFKGQTLPSLDVLLGGGVVFDKKVSQSVRLSDLLFERGHGVASSERIFPELEQHGADGFLRFRYARGFADEGDQSGTDKALGEVADLKTPHFGWFALKGYSERLRGNIEAAEHLFALAVARHPLSEVVGCQGEWQRRSQGYAAATSQRPDGERARQLCEAARRWDTIR